MIGYEISELFLESIIESSTADPSIWATQWQHFPDLLALTLWARDSLTILWKSLLKPLTDIQAVNMNLRLTLQHGIGLQQLFLDLIHLLALPTHCRHIWHHQLTGLWSRATRKSVGSLANLAEEQVRRARPSLHPTFPQPHVCSHVSAQDPCVWVSFVESDGDYYCIILSS